MKLPNGLDFLFFALIIWSLVWKGYALWHAAKNDQRNWFILFVFPLNTVGVLEIIYLFFFAKKKWTLKTVKFWEK